MLKTLFRLTNIKIVKATMKRATSSSSTPSKPEVASKASILIDELIKDRTQTAESVLDFSFKKQRVKILTKVDEVDSKAKGILYWMWRDCRVQDNWAMLFAQKLALKNELPLHVLFCLPPTFIEYTLRHYKFLIKGLQEVAEECHRLNIQFHLLTGNPPDLVGKFVKDQKVGALIVDFLPLRPVMEWQETVLKSMKDSIPIIRVDAHNVVPCWEASDKLEYAARTIRSKINNQLKTFLTPFPPVIKHPHKTSDSNKIEWDSLLDHCKIDRSVDEVDWAIPGYKGGIGMLESFRDSRIKLFGSKRNDPTINALSNLSPWLHFGHISAQRCVLVVRQLRSKHAESVDSYCEEVIIRRELSDNFCFYNPNYDQFKGATNWAQETLNAHRKDKREYVYTREELEHSQTHDDLWNSAQIELIKRGKLHGFMRMYWAKKLLEWTESPEQALADGFYFNDHYALDGNDPNGYVGVMWSICGIHDQGWAERAVFGKIRFMNYAGCKRKFDISAYIARWGGKVHKKNPINEFLTPKKREETDDKPPTKKIKTDNKSEKKSKKK